MVRFEHDHCLIPHEGGLEGASLYSRHTTNFAVIVFAFAELLGTKTGNRGAPEA